MIEIYKGYQVKPHKSFPKTYIIVTDGKGGKIPDVMSGLFTTPGYAKAVIDKYIDTKPKKEVVNGKAIDKG